MAQNWRDWYRNSGDPGSFAHPDSPAGGTGPGFSTIQGYDSSEAGTTSPVPHPHSPAARCFDWSRLRTIDLEERVEAVFRAIRHCPQFLPEAIARATGEELHAVLSGILPGLLVALGVIGVTTLGGVVAGALIGSLAGGVGAAPGAAAGASIGFEAGTWILTYLGLAFMGAYIAETVASAVRKATFAIGIAWRSVDSQISPSMAIDRAARLLADAVADIFRGVLQGIVAFLLSKGLSAAKGRVPELVGRLRKSKLGDGFATWVEQNWERLVRNPKLQPKSVSGPTKSATTPEAAGDSGLRPAKAKVPLKKFAPPLKARHSIKHVKQGGVKKAKNTVAEPNIDMNADVESINRGEGTRNGNLYTVNGRTYELVNGDHLVPHSGPGFHNLNRGELDALGIFNKLGNTEKSRELASRVAGAQGAANALRIWRLGQ